MNLAINRYNLKFRSWVEIYIGLERGWIGVQDLYEFCKILPKCNDDRLAMLYISLEVSQVQFMRKINEFIVEDEGFIIPEKEYPYQEIQIDPSYFQIWELECLLRITTSELSRSQKLEAVFGLHSVFGYPETWKPFLLYGSDEIAGVDNMYHNLMNFINSRMNLFK